MGCIIDWLDAHNPAITGLSTFIIAIFTIVLACVSIYQGKQLRRSVKAMRKEFAATHRPRVRIKHLWFRSGLKPDEKLTFDLLFVNTGSTKATIGDIKFLTYLVVDKGELLPDRQLEGLVTHQIGNEKLREIGSGITTKIEHISDERTLSRQETDDIRRGRIVLYCVGDVEYRDEDQAPRKTAFCRRFVPSHTGRTVDTWTNGRFEIVKEDSDYEYQD